VTSSTSSGPATRAFSQPAAAAIFAPSARRSPGTITRRLLAPHVNTSDLTIWRNSEPTAFAASRAVGVPSGNSSINASVPDDRMKLATRSTGSGQSLIRR
jgi:hypothetical protein